MLKLTNPSLRRSNVVLDSFSSCVANTPKKFSRTPEVSFSKVVSQPGMFFEKFKGTVAFEKLESHANTHRQWHLNKQMDMINSNMELINFESFSVSNFSDKELTIHPQPIKLEGVSCIFNFPDKMESILSKAMFPRFQIHFSSPETLIRNKVLTKLSLIFEEPSILAPHINNSTELNFIGGLIPPKLKSLGILGLM